MMKKVMLTIFLLVLVITTLSGAESEPTMPYYDWGACPFEGCVYREWIAKKKLNAYRDRDESSPIGFTLGPNEKVEALTGVVITIKPGRIKIQKPITLDPEKPVSLKPGDIIFTLHYLGEGYGLFWHDGELHSDEVMVTNIVEETPRNDGPLQVFAIPETEWWVKIKNSKGIIGWTKDTNGFRNKDYFE